MRELEQKDVGDTEGDLAEVRRQKSDMKVVNTLAQELKMVAECVPLQEKENEDVKMQDDERHECVPLQEKENEDVKMQDDERHDESGDVKKVLGDCDEQKDGSMAHVKDGEQSDGSVPEREIHSRQVIARLKRALNTNSGHPGMKEMIQVLKNGRASELAIQEARRIHCGICAEYVQLKLPREAVLRQVLDFNERVGLDILSLPHWGDVARSVTCLNMVCRGTLFQMIIPLWSGMMVMDLRRAYREGWQRWARNPKQIVIDPAEENLHDIFLDTLELNSVEAEVTAAESPWQAGFAEVSGRAFKLVFKKFWT